MDPADLQTLITNYTAALLADSVDPQPNYTISSPGGVSRSVSRDQWRQFMLNMIEKAQELINAVDPYIVQTRMVV